MKMLRVLADLHGASAVAGAVVVCTLEQARQWASAADAVAPALGARLRDAGAIAACIVGMTHADGRTLRWLDAEHARGWLCSGAGEQAAADARRFATNLSEAIAEGFVLADAAVIAVMAHGVEGSDFMNRPERLPLLSWGELARFEQPRTRAPHALGLYPLVDSAQRLRQALAAGIATVQLRIKAPPAPDDAWRDMLRREVQAAIEACRSAGAELYVNDHWRVAAELGAYGVHLGQEDLVALNEDERGELAASGIALGVSSHSLWELCRARALAPRYVACGPVWPTVTKDMPWVAQGMDNLGWWCRMAGVPVVAIGGVLGPEEVRQAARCGADGVCIVRGLGESPEKTVPPLQAALAAGRREHAQSPLPATAPHPSLVG